MKVQRIGGVLLIIFLFGSMILSGQAQSENLLSNPDFESGFRAVPGENTPRNVASSWQPWNVSRGENDPGFQNAQPRYLAASNAGSEEAIPRIRSGADAQMYFSYYETHDAGIYQQVSGVTSGTELRFSIYGYVHSNNLDDLSVSEDPGGVALRVGIDPTGGTDPFSSDVVYSELAIFYDTFRQYSVIATAESSTVTVFVRTTISEPVQFTYVYLDDAVLEATPEQETEEPVETEETQEPANTATSTATATATATATSSNPTPTREENGGVLPTATSVGATATEASNGGGEAPVLDEFPGRIVHTVRSGDTVGQLAVRYGSSIAAIIEANGLDDSALIFTGQGLVIPVRLVPTTETPSPTSDIVATPTTTSNTGGQPPSGNTYVVQPGDTLLNIARRFNTTLTTLVQLNGISNPNRILVGQRLQLPVSAQPTPTPTPVSTTVVQPTPTPVPQPATYTVQPGDNLFRISLRFDVSLVALANANNITNYNRIFVGQVLTIPR
jgi:LysM repeat protein